MAGVLLAEDLHRCLGLRERGDEVGHRGLPVGVVAPGPDRRALAQAGVDDHPVDGAEVLLERTEDLEDLVVVVHVERPDLDPAVRVGGEDAGPDGLQLLRTTCAQRQVVPLGCELPRHLRPQPAARAGDQDVLSLGGHGAHPANAHWSPPDEGCRNRVI